MTPKLTILEEYNWHQLANLLTFIFVQTFKWIGISLLMYQLSIIFYLLWRFCQVKFGKKIKPNGDLAILITGATSGFGLALAKLFYKLGFTVIATYYNDQEIGYKELQELSAQPIKTDGRLNFKRPYLFLIRMDVRSSESIVDCGKQVDLLLMQHDVKLYCLINNAGIAMVMPFQLLGRETIGDIVGTNLTGSMLVTRQFLLRIIQNKGKIITVSSGTHPYPGAKNEVYGSTKAALYHFSLALHNSIKSYGASSLCLIPGNFVTASNIVYATMRALEIVEKSSDEEKNFYQDLIAKSEEYIRNLLAYKLKKSGDSLDEIAAIHNCEKSDFVKKSKEAYNFRTKVIRKFQLVLTGGSFHLEDGLEAFKQAVYVKNPPITLYPGNLFYTYCSGPLSELAPSIFNAWLGKRIIDTLARAII